MPKIVEGLTEDSRGLEEEIRFVRDVERIEKINSQVEKLKGASDAKRPDYTLAPMVTQLIQTVKTWKYRHTIGRGK